MSVAKLDYRAVQRRGSRKNIVSRISNNQKSILFGLDHYGLVYTGRIMHVDLLDIVEFRPEGCYSNLATLIEAPTMECKGRRHAQCLAPTSHPANLRSREIHTRGNHP